MLIYYQENSLSVFYNRRIDRPGEPELRIFPKYDDPELLKAGNPYLRPQFTRVYSIDTSTVDYDIVNKIYQNVDNTWDLKFDNQFILPRGIQAQLTFIYFVPKNIAQRRQMPSIVLVSG